MLEKIPSQEVLQELLDDHLFTVWQQLCALIEESYDMERLWNKGGKAWDYEYKYRRGGKTLCALYLRAGCLGFMVILSKAEREKFENDRDNYTMPVQQLYDLTTTYHDGKWLLLEVKDTMLFDDFSKLLLLKRKPNKNRYSL